MKNTTVIHSEEEKGVVKMFLSNGGHEIVKTTDLIKLIDKNKLNFINEYQYNNSPKYDNDPRFDVFKEVEVKSSEQYLDDNFDFVCESYFKNLYKK